MLSSRPNRSRKSRRPANPLTLPARWSAARLRLEALDERVVPAFPDVVNYAAGSGPDAVVTGDFNNDHVLDLAVANYGTVSVLLGNSNGTFRPAISTLAAANPTSVAVGDFNADGKLDLVVGSGDSVNYRVTVLLGEGNGSFQSPGWDTGSYSGGRSMSVGDFNADGKLDLAIVSDYYGITCGYYGCYDPPSYVAVLVGTGTGTFGEPRWSYLGGDHHNSAVAADFNADGTLDLAATSDDGYVDVVLGYGNLYFYSYEVAYDTVPTSAVAADVDNDGRVDLATANYFDDTVSVLPNGLFGSPQSHAAGSTPDALTAADFSGDGFIDLITANYDSDTVSVLLGAGAGAFRPPVPAIVGSGPSGVAVGDFNGDGRMDAAVTNYWDDSVSVLLNDGVWDTTPWPTAAINDVTLTEGNSGSTTAAFNVTLSAASSATVTVDYATADGTATAGSDYVGQGGTLTFAPGETTKTVTVAVLGDRVAEPNETFFVTLSGATNAAIAVHQSHGTILDDDPRVSINDVTSSEGNTGQTAFAFTVTLSTAYDLPVMVDWTTADGTAAGGNDYQAASGTLSFAPRETSKTITILVNGDRVPEPNKTFLVSLTNLNYGAIVNSQGVGTIRDDEPRISISNVSKREGRKNTASFNFTVTLSAAYDQPVTMSFRTVDGTARTSDQDYVARTGTLTFAPGETSKTITIEVKGDSNKESNESFYLDLFGLSSNGLFTKTRGIGTILNDD